MVDTTDGPNGSSNGSASPVNGNGLLRTLSQRRASAPMAPAFMVSAPGKVIVFGEHSVVYGKVHILPASGIYPFCGFTERKNNFSIANWPFLLYSLLSPLPSPCDPISTSQRCRSQNAPSRFASPTLISPIHGTLTISPGRNSNTQTRRSPIILWSRSLTPI